MVLSENKDLGENMVFGENFVFGENMIILLFQLPYFSYSNDTKPKS